MDNLVIVDLGSNSVRMTINEVRPDKTFRELGRYKEDSRLSEGMGREKILQEPAIQRTLTALHAFKQRYQTLPNLTVKAITTAAVRQASNQADFFWNGCHEKLGCNLTFCLVMMKPITIILV